MALVAASTALGLAVTDARAHDGQPHAGHDGRHVGEVEVDEPRHQDEVGDALNRLPEHVIGRGEGIGHRGRAVERGQQPLVRNRDDAVDALPELFEPPLRLQRAPAALERKRLGHDGHGQHAQLTRQVRDDRCRPGAGAAAQPGRDKHHISPVQRGDDLPGVLECRLPADVRVCACTEPLRELGADLQAQGRSIVAQRLCVRVGHDILDAAEPGAHHPVHGVAPAAPDTDDLDPRADVIGVLDRHAQVRVPLGSLAGDRITGSIRQRCSFHLAPFFAFRWRVPKFATPMLPACDRGA